MWDPVHVRRDTAACRSEDSESTVPLSKDGEWLGVGVCVPQCLHTIYTCVHVYRMYSVCLYMPLYVSVSMYVYLHPVCVCMNAHVCMCVLYVFMCIGVHCDRCAVFYICLCVYACMCV